MDEGETVFRLKTFEVGGKHAKGILQRARFRIRVDEHETAPAPHLNLRQTVLLWRHLRKIPGTGNIVEAAIELPFPPMKRAAHALARTVAIAQTRPTVQA